MGIAALILWLLTAAGGFVLLGTWIAKGGTKSDGHSKLPPAVVFGHFVLAAVGLVVWIIYVITDSDALRWPAFVLLVLVVGLAVVVLSFAQGGAGYAVPLAQNANNIETYTDGTGALVDEGGVWKACHDFYFYAESSTGKTSP